MAKGSWAATAAHLRQPPPFHPSPHGLSRYQVPPGLLYLALSRAVTDDDLAIYLDASVGAALKRDEVARRCVRSTTHTPISTAFGVRYRRNATPRPLSLPPTAFGLHLWRDLSSSKAF